MDPRKTIIAFPKDLGKTTKKEIDEGLLLVDKQVGQYGISSGFVEESSNFEGWKTIAFNPQTLKSELIDFESKSVDYFKSIFKVVISTENLRDYLDSKKNYYSILFSTGLSYLLIRT